MRSRDKFPPGGWRFYQAETNWSPPTWQSFHDTVVAIMQHRNQNPHQRDRFGWKSDYESVSAELDLYNAKIAAQMGWNDYVAGEGIPDPPPKTLPRSPQLPSGRNVAGGVKALADWTIDGEIVPEEIAVSRAAVCTNIDGKGTRCPVNRPGAMADFFTEAAAKAIQLQFEIRQVRKLSTPFDAQLGLCDGCGCPLKLKVHAPLHIITKHLRAEDRAKLHPNCWILK